MTKLDALVAHLANHPTGLFHTFTAVLSLIFGTIVLCKIKGTKTHKIFGYIYLVNMLLLNLSSFFIQNFNRFSLFHFFAIVSIASITMGFVPALYRRKNWFGYHFYGMSWSVVGLYCAFWAELGTRFVSNMKAFWWVVALATILTSMIGLVIINRNAKKLNLR